MTRRAFDPSDEGGGQATGAAPERKRLRYSCAALNCPMPGTINHDAACDIGECAWHFGEAPHAWPVITQALRDWACAVRAVLEVRRALSDSGRCLDGRAMRAVMQAQAQQLAAEAPDWPELQPNAAEGPAEWLHRLESFVVARTRGEAPMRQLQIDASSTAPGPAPSRRPIRASSWTDDDQVRALREHERIAAGVAPGAQSATADAFDGRDDEEEPPWL